MTNFVWHSKANAESAVWLAKQLKTKGVGTVPGRSFEGVALCWGATVSSKFKWDSRTFTAMMNDPRKVRPYADRRELFNKLGEAGLSVLSCVPLSEQAQYANICSLLAANVVEGFIVSKTSGASARLVSTQADLQTAIEAGCNRAIDSRFGAENRFRIFVVDGVAVAALQKAPSTNENFAQNLAKSMYPEATTAQLTSHTSTLMTALEKKFIKPTKTFWSALPSPHAAMTNRAVSAAAALGFDFCAVDLVSIDGNIDVINVVTTPNLREAPSIQKPVVAALSSWIRKNTMTAKEILTTAVAAASEAEAATLLAFLKESQQPLAIGG